MTHVVGRRALEKLLDFAESAKARGGKPRGLVFSGSSFPHYRVDSVQALEEIHAMFAAAERAGAIVITWDRRSGDRGQVERIDLVDGEILARHLGITPHWTLVEQARGALTQWRGKWSVDWLLSQWEGRKAPRERGPSTVHAFVDAIRTLDALAAGGDKVSMRRLSASLFGDSKRIEAIAVELDLLTRIDDGPARSDQELFSEIGLLHYPQPFLMAAENGFALLENGQRQAILKPYLGLDPATLSGAAFEGNYILSVENLTTFNELARGGAGEIRGLLLYTGGMPGPAWMRAYNSAIGADSVAIYHWGDTDVGGIRVLAKLDTAARRLGKSVSPLQMGTESRRSRKPLSDREVEYMCEICRGHDWGALMESVTSLRLAIEQESQDLSLPQ